MLLVDATAGAAQYATVNDHSAAYDLVLLAHVLSALVGLVAVTATGGFALALRAALRHGGPLPEALIRYYRPGVNRVGRVLFAVPVFGVALVAMSGGQWRWSDVWVSGGMAAWAAVAMVGEGALWPGERRLQLVVARAGRHQSDVADGGAEPPDAETTSDRPDGGAAGHCLTIAFISGGCAAALVAVAALMVAKP